jgi:hypothetical protein
MNQCILKFFGKSIWCRLVFICTFLLIFACSAVQAQSDVFLSGLILYTKLPEGSSEAKEYGMYPQIKSYDLHGGLAPDKVDVVVVVNGKPSEEVSIVLEVFPVVGLTNWNQTEGITDLQLLESSKTTLSGVLRLEKTQRFEGRTDIKFVDIDLSKIIKHFTQRCFWPAELIFKATAEPVLGETALSNNVMEFKLEMTPID